MQSRRSEEMQRARHARDALASRFLNDPNVTLIDIGRSTRAPDAPLALRIHVKSAQERAMQGAFPDEVDGIPVIVVRGDYRLE